MFIHLTDLKVETLIGVHDFERKSKREVIFDIDIEIDDIDIDNDTISSTLDYYYVEQLVIDISQKSNFQLIESLIKKVREEILTLKYAKKVNITLHKPNALKNCNVSVSA